MTIAIYFMHRRLLTSEKWHWYIQDISIPLTAGTVVAVFIRWATPPLPGSFLVQLIVLLLSAALVLASSALAAQGVRKKLVNYLPQGIKSILVKAL